MRIAQKITQFIRNNLGMVGVKINGKLIEIDAKDVSVSFPAFYYLEDKEFKKKFMEEEPKQNFNED